MRKLAALEEPGLVAFSREGLLNSEQISPSRVLSFAVLELTGEYLDADHREAHASAT